jgi:hypothetical protein
LKWNCSSNVMAGSPGPSTDFYASLPLIRHGHRGPFPDGLILDAGSGFQKTRSPGTGSTLE